MGGVGISRSGHGLDHGEFRSNCRSGDPRILTFVRRSRVQFLDRPLGHLVILHFALVTRSANLNISRSGMGPSCTSFRPTPVDHGASRSRRRPNDGTTSDGRVDFAEVNEPAHRRGHFTMGVPSQVDTGKYLASITEPGSKRRRSIPGWSPRKAMGATDGLSQKIHGGIPRGSTEMARAEVTAEAQFLELQKDQLRSSVVTYIS